MTDSLGHLFVIMSVLTPLISGVAQTLRIETSRRSVEMGYSCRSGPECYLLNPKVSGTSLCRRMSIVSGGEHKRSLTQAARQYSSFPCRKRDALRIVEQKNRLYKMSEKDRPIE